MNRGLAFAMLIMAVPGFTGCRDSGVGGTGEWVVPRRTFRQIDAVDPSDFGDAPATVPSTAPSTLPSTRPVTGPVREVPLTLAEVRVLALENNLDLRVERFNPSIARQGISEEEARFESLFTTTIEYTDSDQPTATQLQGSQVTDLRVTPGIEIPLRTGGAIRLAAPIGRFETNNQFATLNPAFSSDIAATITQPLLRGSGSDINAQRIRIAFYAYQQSQARTKLEVIRVLAAADRLYWRLYAARQELLVRRQEYDLAVAQLERARRQVAVGTAAEVEIIRAQSGVADRVEGIIIADNTVRDRERELKWILNAPDLSMESPTALVTATEPRPVYYAVDSGRMIERSLNHRMELLDIELQIARETADVRFARNDMLPLVSLAYTYNVNGLGGDLNESFEMTRSNDFVDHLLSLRVEVPIGNEAARSRLRRAMLNRLQSLATREQRELQVRQEVLNAVDQLEANWQRILAARQRVIAQARVLEVEIRQFEQQIRTSTEVLEAQTRLANARLSEISAVSDYQIAQVDLAYATGTLLGASQVTWEPAGAPQR